MLSNLLTTLFVPAWSGATPLRTRPNGVGSFSMTSTFASSPNAARSLSAAYIPAGPLPTTQKRRGSDCLAAGELKCADASAVEVKLRACLSRRSRVADASVRNIASPRRMV
jgi:hypothetical protein